MKEINFIRPQEVYDRNTGESLLRYRSYDGAERFIKGSPNGTPKTIHTLEQLFGSTLTSKDEVSVEYPMSPTDFITFMSSWEEPSADEITTNLATIELADVEFISKNDTILVLNQYGYKNDGILLSKEKLILSVVSVDYENNQITCFAVNGKKIGDFYQCVPSIEEDEEGFVMGSGSSDVMPLINEASIFTNRCKMQELALSFEEENSLVSGAITAQTNLNADEQYRLREFISRREATYLVGAESPNNEQSFIKGIFYQTNRSYVYSYAGASVQTLYDIAEKAFSGSFPHSAKKIALCGKELLKKLIPYLDGKNVFTSPYGIIEFFYYPTFDDTNQSRNGIVIDPAYIKIYNQQELQGRFENGVMAFSQKTAILLNEQRCHTTIEAV